MQPKRSFKGNGTVWFMFAAGFVFILVGIFAEIYPWNTYVKIITYSGFAIIANSLFILVHALNDRHTLLERICLIAEGCLDMVVGTTLVFNPFLAAIAFPLMSGYWMIFRGCIKLALVLFSKITRFARIIMSIIGGLSVLFGAIILFDPFVMNQPIAHIIGVFLILMGILYCYDAFRFRKQSDVLNMMV